MENQAVNCDEVLYSDLRDSRVVFDGKRKDEYILIVDSNKNMGGKGVDQPQVFVKLVPALLPEYQVEAGTYRLKFSG
jgi:hypothetical protein